MLLFFIKKKGGIFQYFTKSKLFFLSTMVCITGPNRTRERTDQTEFSKSLSITKNLHCTEREYFGLVQLELNL